MTDRKIHTLHKGEVRVQALRHTPAQTAEAMPRYITWDMPQQHAEFFAGLSYLPLATLDDRGRPWASLLVTKSQKDPSIGIKVAAHNTMDVAAVSNAFDPFVRALEQVKGASTADYPLFAGVGVDFSNRRRNKLAGSIEPVSLGASGLVNFRLHSNQHLGNCPKYITVRTLEHHTRDPELVVDGFDDLTSPLPDAAKVLLDRATTAFLATKHLSDGQDDSDQDDMGLNHRGGAPGFVRVHEEVEDGAVTTYLMLPDHSGNRFYQSLGNIDTNKQAGLVFPDFTTGDVLYVTGDAENLFDEDADDIMPRVSLLTRFRLTGAVFVKGGLHLRLTSEEQHSPYNPPVRYTRHELEKLGRAAVPPASAEGPIMASLMSAVGLTDTVSTFNFKLSEPIDPPVPGGFGVFDFSGLLDAGYSHMNEANPQLVNEDYIRTWTLSSAASFDVERRSFSKTDHVSVTVKRKPNGLISNVLHELAAHIEKQDVSPIQLKFRGTGGDFSCLNTRQPNKIPTVPSKMLWVVGGVGITPFMSMWTSLQDIVGSLPPHADAVWTDITLMFSGRDDDINLLRHFLKDAEHLQARIRLKVIAYQSVWNETSQADAASHSLHTAFSGSGYRLERRRVQASDFEIIDDLLQRDVFLCGPDALMRFSEQALLRLGVEEQRMHQESYFF